MPLDIIGEAEHWHMAVGGMLCHPILAQISPPAFKMHHCCYVLLNELDGQILVLNSANKKVQYRLLETYDLDMSKALKIVKIHGTNIEQMKLISSNDAHYVGSRRERNPAPPQVYAAPPVSRTDGARLKTWRSPDDAECSKCGRMHTTIQTCPAQGKACNTCGKRNHFSAMCRSTAPTQSAAVRQRRLPQRVHAINDADYDICWTRSLPSDAL